MEENLESIGDWEANFKALKRKSREAEKTLPPSVTIDCLAVSCRPIRNAVDDQLQVCHVLLPVSMKVVEGCGGVLYQQ